MQSYARTARSHAIPASAVQRCKPDPPYQADRHFEPPILQMSFAPFQCIPMNPWCSIIPCIAAIGTCALMSGCVHSQRATDSLRQDVIEYRLTLEVDVTRPLVRGKELIRFDP